MKSSWWFVLRLVIGGLLHFSAPRRHPSMAFNAIFWMLFHRFFVRFFVRFFTRFFTKICENPIDSVKTRCSDSFQDSYGILSRFLRFHLLLSNKQPRDSFERFFWGTFFWGILSRLSSSIHCMRFKPRWWCKNVIIITMIVSIPCKGHERRRGASFWLSTSSLTSKSPKESRNNDRLDFNYIANNSLFSEMVIAFRSSIHSE